MQQGQKGTLKAFNVANGYGFIHSNLVGKDAFIHIRNQYSACGSASPQPGQSVTFIIDPPSTGNNPSAQLACIETGSVPSNALISTDKANALDKTDHHNGTKVAISSLEDLAGRDLRPQVNGSGNCISSTGRVTKIVADKKYAYVTPNAGGIDHFMYLRKISEFSLPLKVGDFIKFKASEMNGKMSIQKAQVETFTLRSKKEMAAYFRSILAAVQTPKAYCLTLELSKLRTLWLYCGNHGRDDPNFGSYAKIFLTMITEFLKEKSPLVDPEEPLGVLFKETDFVTRLVKTTLKTRDDSIFFDVFGAFCKQIIAYVPKFLPSLFPLVQMGSQESVESLLIFTIIRQISESLQGSWKSLPEAITEEELARNDLIAGGPNLLPVKNDTPYDSVQEYMDTYFRLLRAEAFYGIQRGIAQFRGGELDLHDMNVYVDITLVAMDLQKLRLVLSFTPLKKVKNWEKSKGLLEGNLLCVCSDNQFKDVVWFIIADRDTDMLNQQSQEDISTIDESIGSPKPGIKDGHLEAVGQFVEHAKLTMDSAQKAAFEYALRSPLAIIQGPPGTGKTFIGTKLMEAILLAEPSSPILVLTYKNHALDEFLKHCLKFCSLKDIVRVGGGSKAEELNECNLTLLLQSQRDFFSQDLIDIRKEVESTLASLTSKIANQVSLVLDSVAVNSWTIFNKMTADQLSSLAKDAPWGKGPGKIEFPTQTNQCANRTWVDQKVDLALIDGQNLQELLQEAEGSKAKLGEDKTLAIDLLIHAAKAWMPPLDKLKELKTLQSNFSNFTALQPVEDKFDDPNEDDEEQLKELRESRLTESYKRSGGQSKKYPFWPLPVTPGGLEDNFTIQDFPPQAKAQSKSQSKLHVSNMWELNTIQRYRFLYSLVQLKSELASESLNERVVQVQCALQKLSEIRNLKKVEILSHRKIIGMTVSGASINSAILQQVRPKIIVVEEAAEVLEPLLIAAMNKDVDHLILIGDHKQLRPQVESYPLVKKYGFSMSLMERLINCGFPYKPLQVQNRMRPEFAEMLLDIYPNLKPTLRECPRITHWLA
eukprot:maker-scaffold1620_size33299-snap-gene-0.6 protein:Tk08280 transcript:maker-scaffold1620_size33299-snap-gene-0.6-mRNA-1 annotation:"nfx1-type zinc finger-containing protein 1-like"